MTQRVAQYRAHPAFTLKEMDCGDPLALPLEYFGFRWLKSERAERERQEEAFFSALLGELGATPGATLVAEFSSLEDAEAFASAWDLYRDGYDVTGESSAANSAALVHERLEAAEINTADQRTILRLEQQWRGVAVWLDDAHATSLRLRLEVAARTGAGDDQVTRSGRPLRAALFIVFAHLTWIVPSLIGVATMIGLNRLDLGLVIAIPLGFVVIAALILGPPVTAVRRVLQRLLA